ncbi:hypothetical protein [Aridibaculum aurantiacum]|uniref:hypothetical protein n=1 Tax=Aridibaculum aurantiacum TaxID=2810307 RepID=UPI001A974BE5|nr:hypothetical protein [Aridibaculum aurantiacum]
MKQIFCIICSINLIANVCVAQSTNRQTISNCKVTFDVTVIDTTAPEEVVRSVGKAVKISNVKDRQSRNDVIATGYKQTAIFKERTDTIVVLKEVGREKYISYIDSRTFNRKIAGHEGIKFTTTTDSKNILGFECLLAQAQMPDGSYFNVNYAPAIEPSHKAFQQQFQELPGFVLEYEAYLEDRKTKVRYKATAIDRSIVPAALFDWPKSGYRIISN